jgi:hypothetical protein
MQPPVSRRNRSDVRPACCAHAHTIPTERPTSWRARSLIVAPLLGVALALAGCGGSSAPAVAHLSSGNGASLASSKDGRSAPESVTTHQQKEIDYAKCLRAHGAGAASHTRIGGPGSGIDPNSPRFEAAGKACRKYFGPAGSKRGPAASTSGGGGKPSGQAAAQ